MLSSLTQFLPQALQQNLPGHQPQVHDTDAASMTTTSEGHTGERPCDPSESRPCEPTTANGRRRRREKKPATLYETFIVVRPPPSKSNHPLNLQVQLVPPSHARDSSSRSVEGNQSSDTVNDPNALHRTSSTRSNRSATSLYSAPSVASVTSLASSNASGSSSSSARRIIPLYNLSAHNVITNTVTDAGTDAKIAKFGKRGIELNGLGILEGYEVRHTATGAPQHALAPLPPLFLSPDHLNPSSDPAGLERVASPSKSLVSNTSATSIPTSASSQLSENSKGNVQTPTKRTSSIDNGPTTPVAGGSAKKFFGKIFRKKDSSSTLVPSSPSAPTSTPTTPTPATTSFFRTPKSRFGRSENANPASVTSPITPTPETPKTSTTVGPQPTLQPPVLGTQVNLTYRSTSLSPEKENIPLAETESPYGSPPTSLVGHGTPIIIRPIPSDHHSIEWVIRRWIKGNGEGWLGNALMSATSGVFPPNTAASAIFPGSGEGIAGTVEVKFEWTRGRGSRVRERERKDRERRRIGTSDGGDEGGRRSRPVSMNLTVGNVGSLGGRPSSMFISAPANTSKTSLTDKKSRPMSLQPPLQQVAVTSGSLGRSPSPLAARPSMESSRRSSSQSGGTSNTHEGKSNGAPLRHTKSRTGTLAGGEDDGDQSDPEDSETPWTCTLWVTPIGDATPNGRTSISEGSHQVPSSTQTTPSKSRNLPGGGIKLKLATLTPAPHHPKVVSQLKMPFPLPGVSITKMELLDKQNADLDDDLGLILTAEEIKDIVCVTGLWLMVREGFGGLDRKRKGDGWRIRG